MGLGVSVLDSTASGYLVRPIGAGVEMSAYYVSTYKKGNIHLLACVHQVSGRWRSETEGKVWRKTFHYIFF